MRIRYGRSGSLHHHREALAHADLQFLRQQAESCLNVFFAREAPSRKGESGPPRVRTFAKLSRQTPSTLVQPRANTLRLLAQEARLHQGDHGLEDHPAAPEMRRTRARSNGAR